MMENRIPDGEDDADATEDEKAGPTSRTVVNNDFASWIDPTSGQLLHQEVSNDDSESVRSARTSLEETESNHYGKLYKAADACHISWFARFIENVGYFLSMSFPEKLKERAYLKDVSLGDCSTCGANVNRYISSNVKSPYRPRSSFSSCGSWSV